MILEWRLQVSDSTLSGTEETDAAKSLSVGGDSEISVGGESDRAHQDRQDLNRGHQRRLRRSSLEKKSDLCVVRTTT